MSSVSFDEKLVAPIAGDVAVGLDLTYEPDFQALQTEVEQATSLSARSVDWSRVQEASGRLLREKSKDLRLASWWLVAATHTEGWDGLARGLGLYGALVDQHWEGMFPPAKRAKARAGLVEWTWEGARKALAARDVTPGQVAAVRASLAALGEVDRGLGERLGDLAPGIGPLRSLLREKAESIPETPPPAPAPPPPEAKAPVPLPQSAPAAAALPTAPPVPSGPAAMPAPVVAPELPAGSISAENVSRVATDWRERLFALARAARSADATSPFPYRVARTAAWLTVDAPPDVEKGKTFVKAPRSDDVREIRGLCEAGQWSQALDAIEAALIEHPFWLDLSYLSYAALDRLGPPFAGARAAVLHETLAFLDRVPGLDSLAFRDGSPFASPDTAAWLRAKRGTGVAAGAPAESSEDAVAALLERVRTACGDGRVGEALAGGLMEARSLNSARTRFRARLELGKLAVEEGRQAVGVSVFEELLGEIDASLETWEPRLCAETIGAILEAGSFQAESAVDERQRLLFRRLLKLDPASAMRIGS